MEVLESLSMMFKILPMQTTLKNIIKHITIVLFCFAFFLFPNLSTAQTAEEREGKIKAATLYYIARFTHWPTGYFNTENKQLTTCVLGEDTINKFLETNLSGKDINGNIATIKFIDKDISISSSAELLKQCAILYVGRNLTFDMIEILKNAQHTHTLTIGIDPNFTKSEGMVYFGKDANKIQLTINIRNTRRASLVISSDILELAQIDGPS